MTERPVHQIAEHARRVGFASGVAAYVLWGVFPIYFHLLKERASPDEILVHRVIWSLPVVAAILFRRGALATIRPVMRDRRTLGVLTISALLIATNWLIFVWSIAHERLLEASMGYFINPLVSVALGMIFLRERLDRMQVVSIVLASIGVGYLVLHAPGFPWIALALAFSFGLYGLVRKTVRVDAPTGFFMETMILLPFAVAYFFYLTTTGGSHFLSDAGVLTLLVLGGPLTAAPLLLFTKAVRLLPLSVLGFLQYIAPTLQFALAVFAFHESFDPVKAAAFGFIWVAIAVFVADLARRRQPRG